LQKWGLLGADLEPESTAWMESAARRRIDGAWDLPLQGENLAPDLGIGNGYRGEQKNRVGVAGMRVDLMALRNLHDLPQIHHRHAVGDVLHHVQIVGDEDVGEVELILKRDEEIENLGLHGHVEEETGSSHMMRQA